MERAGGKLLPILTKLLKAIEPVIDLFVKLDNAANGWLSVMLLFGTALGGVIASLDFLKGILSLLGIAAPEAAAVGAAEVAGVGTAAVAGAAGVGAGAAAAGEPLQQARTLAEGVGVGTMLETGALATGGVAAAPAIAVGGAVAGTVWAMDKYNAQIKDFLTKHFGVEFLPGATHGFEQYQHGPDKWKKEKSDREKGVVEAAETTRFKAA